MPWSVIPQIFYDLIARVIPGATVLASRILDIVWAYEGNKDFLYRILTENVFNFGTLFRSSSWPIFWDLSCVN